MTRRAWNSQHKKSWERWKYLLPWFYFYTLCSCIKLPSCAPWRCSNIKSQLKKNPTRTFCTASKLPRKKPWKPRLTTPCANKDTEQPEPSWAAGGKMVWPLERQPGYFYKLGSSCLTLSDPTTGRLLTPLCKYLERNSSVETCPLSQWF
jgi:hypothetical protein